MSDSELNAAVADVLEFGLHHCHGTTYADVIGAEHAAAQAIIDTHTLADGRVQVTMQGMPLPLISWNPAVLRHDADLAGLAFGLSRQELDAIGDPRDICLQILREARRL